MCVYGHMSLRNDQYKTLRYEIDALNVCVYVYMYVCACVCVYVCILLYTWSVKSHTSSHDKTGFYLRGVQIYLRQMIRHALESGLFPLSQHPINTNRVRAVPLVLDPQLLPR